jgi:hypothetical protein
VECSVKKIDKIEDIENIENIENIEKHVMTHTLVMVQRTYPKCRVINLPAYKSNYK